MRFRWLSIREGPAGDDGQGRGRAEVAEIADVVDEERARRTSPPFVKSR
jgi:hypothetical protein